MLKSNGWQFLGSNFVFQHIHSSGLWWWGERWCPHQVHYWASEEPFPNHWCHTCVFFVRCSRPWDFLRQRSQLADRLLPSWERRHALFPSQPTNQAISPLCSENGGSSPAWVPPKWMNLAWLRAVAGWGGGQSHNLLPGYFPGEHRAVPTCRVQTGAGPLYWKPTPVSLSQLVSSSRSGWSGTDRPPGLSWGNRELCLLAEFKKRWGYFAGSRSWVLSGKKWSSLTASWHGYCGLHQGYGSWFWVAQGSKTCEASCDFEWCLCKKLHVNLCICLESQGAKTGSLIPRIAQVPVRNVNPLGILTSSPLPCIREFLLAPHRYQVGDCPILLFCVLCVPWLPWPILTWFLKWSTWS